MYGLPKGTEFAIKIPKKKFYEELDLSTKIKQAFVDEIKSITWSNKISEQTTNIKKGKSVVEIEVFEINLKQKDLNQSVLQQIDRQIPYYIVFILCYEGKYKVVTGYKEKAIAGSNAFKVGSYYSSEWTAEEPRLIIKGLDLDVVYENILRDIGAEVLNIDIEESIKESVERAERIKKLENEKNKLEKKMYRTKQLNKQMEISDQIRKINKEIKSLK